MCLPIAAFGRVVAADALTVSTVDVLALLVVDSTFLAATCTLAAADACGAFAVFAKCCGSDVVEIAVGVVDSRCKIFRVPPPKVTD